MLAGKAGAKVLRHPRNRGYDRALWTGFTQAKFDGVLICDADGSYPASEVRKLFPGIPDFDVVIGARQGGLFGGTPAQAFLRRNLQCHG